MILRKDKLNTSKIPERSPGQFVAMIFTAILLHSIAAYGQPLGIDLGIDLENPKFLREFNGSFEVGLRPGAPAMNERESVLISVVSETYLRDVDEALSFILEEIRRERGRVTRAQRYRRSNDFDYVYSANIEFTIGQLYQLKGNRALAERYYLQAIEKYP